MEASAFLQLLHDPTITLKINGRLSHHTGHPEGSGVKILMCHISLAQGGMQLFNGTFLVQGQQYFGTIPAVNLLVVLRSRQICLSLPSICGTKHSHWANPATRNDGLAAGGATSTCCQVSTGVVKTADFPSHATGLYSATLVVHAVARAACRVISTRYSSAISTQWFC